MTESYELNEPDSVTVGTVGEVGERVFLLQVRQGLQLVTMKVEKSQISTLCRVLGRLLRGFERPEDLPDPSSLELEEPHDPDFVVRTLRVGYDGDADRVILLCDEIDRGDELEDAEADEVEGSVVRLAMTREQAMALAIRGIELVEAGRPICPRCGYPLDPRGHVCPRMNGNAPPLT
ncbi:MAG TPA: DUF3090 family protein [Acidimicrobiales bacterium]|nr:DUF3090 family protein [Acidimicrobiales bacterium]